MKKINLLLVFVFFAGVAFFTSCTFTSSDNAVMTITPQNDTVLAGVQTDVKFTVTIEPDIINNVSITKLYIDLGEISLDSVTFTQVAQTVTYEYVFEVSDTVKNDDYFDITFTAFDSNDNMVAEMASIVVGTSSASPTIVSFTGKTINYNNGSTTNWNNSKPFFGLNTDGIVELGPSATVANIDLALATQDVFGTALCSPNAAWFETVVDANVNITWSASGKNHTKLERINVTDWAGMTADYIDNLTVADSKLNGITANGSGVDHVVKNDYIAFETTDGVKGVLKITAATNSVGTKATSSVTCDGKVLVPASAGK